MISQNISLKKYNTFGIEVNAANFATFDSVEKLHQLVRSTTLSPITIFGGGSNVLLTKDVGGLVLRNEIKGIKIIQESEQEVIVEAGAGEIWHEFVLFCIDHGFGGVENLSLIPGSVGASPMQNIGAYGVEIKDVFESLCAYEIETGLEKIFYKAECEFGYRESVFKRALKGKYVITHVSFRLQKNPKLNTSYGAIEQELKAQHIEKPTLRDISNAVIAIRKSKLPDPSQLGNAGSFFKNPVVTIETYNTIKEIHPDAPSYPAGEGNVKMAAGWLIEKSGWKGFTRNHFGVHKNQALVLVNYGGATGSEIWNLSSEIIQSIEENFKITLEREVNIL